MMLSAMHAGKGGRPRCYRPDHGSYGSVFVMFPTSRGMANDHLAQAEAKIRLQNTSASSARAWLQPISGNIRRHELPLRENLWIRNIPPFGAGAKCRYPAIPESLVWLVESWQIEVLFLALLRPSTPRSELTHSTCQSLVRSPTPLASYCILLLVLVDVVILLAQYVLKLGQNLSIYALVRNLRAHNLPTSDRGDANYPTRP